MRLLLDTHVLLWAVLDDPRLPARLCAALADPAAEVAVSAATVWEVAIKTALGKLEVPEALWATVRAAGVRPLAVTWAHAEAVASLPPHHGDPFDRLLVAQARAEGMTLVSLDRQIARYDVALLSG